MIKHASPREISAPETNLLLQKLDPADYESLMKRAKVVTLKLRRRLFRQDDAVDAVYFPLSCMISLLVTTGGEPRMELATVGREGVVGAAELLQNQGAMGLNLIQIPGTAVRITASAFLAEISGRPGLSRSSSGISTRC